MVEGRYYKKNGDQPIINEKLATTMQQNGLATKYWPIRIQ